MGSILTRPDIALEASKLKCVQPQARGSQQATAQTPVIHMVLMLAKYG